MAMSNQLKLAFLGATGRMGHALAVAHAKAGHNVIIGSRDVARAAEAAEKAKQQLAAEQQAGSVEGAELSAAADAADVVFLVYGGFVNQDKEEELARRAATLQQLGPHLANKVVVDVTNIGYLVGEESWGQTSSLLMNMKTLEGHNIKWACAWKHVAWTIIENGGNVSNPLSVFVCADDNEAKATVSSLVNSLGGFTAVDAGGVKESKIVELLGPMWLVALKRNNFPGQEFPGWRFGLA